MGVCEAAVAEDQALAPGRAVIILVERAHADAARAGRIGDPRGVEARREFEAGVQPGLQADQARRASGPGGHRGQHLAQDGAALGVAAARAPDVALQVPLGDQREDRALHRPGGVAIGQRLQRRHPRAERGGGDQVADPQRRGQRLGEGADVGDAPLAIEAEQRGEGGRVEPELAVVIILDDQAVVLPRPLQQGQPPRDRQPPAERILVRGGDAGHHRRVGTARQPLDLHPVGIDRHRHHARPVPQQDIARHRVARFLEGDRLARGDRGAHDQLERLRRPGGDHHVVRAAGHAARAAHPARQRLAQRGVAGGRGVAIRR